MKTIELGKTGLQISEVALGCMRMDKLSKSDATAVLEASKEAGINFYDHADIYGKGESEKRFAEAIKDTSIKREDIILQSKAGIRSGFYDFSKEHIIKSVDGILKRLETDYIDVFLLHRPDALVEPEEVAEAFDQLRASGKVKQFGVSNHSPNQIELLKKYVKQTIVANQLQMSVMHTGMIDAGVQVNTKHEASIDHDRAILDYCRLNDITVQPWSPVQGSKGVFLNHSDYSDINETLKSVSEKYETNHEALAIAWLLRHPAQMQVILGTMTPDRIKNYASASGIELSREDWYAIYRGAGNQLP
ncbi:MAG: aldo/keto reductase [Alkalibacterium sp.]|nr:aldo/keto reductase [Alkalibacterium sp.]